MERREEDKESVRRRLPSASSWMLAQCEEADWASHAWLGSRDGSTLVVLVDGGGGASSVDMIIDDNVVVFRSQIIYIFQSKLREWFERPMEHTLPSGHYSVFFSILNSLQAIEIECCSLVKYKEGKVALADNGMGLRKLWCILIKVSND